MGPDGQHLRGSGASLPSIGLTHAAQADRDRDGRFVTIAGEPPDLTDLQAGCPFAARCSHTLPQCTELMPGPVGLQLEHTVRCWLYGAGPSAAATGLQWSAVVTVPLLRAVDVSKTFRRSRTESVVCSLVQLNLHVAAGETVALVGESGSGKSTLGPDRARLARAGRRFGVRCRTPIATT